MAERSDIKFLLIPDHWGIPQSYRIFRFEWRRFAARLEAYVSAGKNEEAGNRPPRFLLIHGYS